MKCHQCGETMSDISPDGRVECGACGTAFVLQMERASVDRVVLQSEPGECICPACHETLWAAEIDEEPVEFCKSCHGILFTQEVFADIVWQRRATFKGTEDTPVPINPADFEIKRPCPCCDRIMECHPYYGPGNAVIDTCISCKVVWLDSGELRTIERAPGQR